MQTRAMKTYTMLLLLLTLCALLLLFCFQTLPELSTHDDLITIQQAQTQVTREEFLVKEALILVYQPVHLDSAINGLQTTLPVFQEIQSGLLNGSPQDGLSNNPPDGAKEALLSANSSYQALDTAFKKLLTPLSIQNQQIQLSIILNNDQQYAQTMYQAALSFQSDAETRKTQLYIIEISLTIITAGAVVSKYTFFTNIIFERIQKFENQRT